MGQVTADVDLPNRNPPEKVLLRFRLPDNAKIASASAGDQQLNVTDGQTIDLSKLKGHVTVVAKVSS